MIARPKLDRDRLEQFLQALPWRVRQIFEYRDWSWYGDEVHTLLERHGAAMCLHGMRGSSSGR